MFKKLLLLFFITTVVAEIATAQSLTGFWNGKISRKSGKGYGADNLEVHIYQSGNQIWGYTFAYTDTSRFVLYRFDGTLNKKAKQVYVEEYGYAYVLLPDQFNPCEKKFDLQYTKIGKTRYLTGKWSGVSIDTTCYPDEELLVALQKVNIPFWSEDMDMAEKIHHFINNKKKYTKVEPGYKELVSPARDLVHKTKSELESRRLEIQQILAVKDSVIKISLYDNAENDGDTLSVFLNKKPFIIRQCISNKPLIFTIPFTNKTEAIELLFQAENLGEIPPNTGVMIVEVDGRRYEILVKSDFEKHAVVIFTPGN